MVDRGQSRLSGAQGNGIRALLLATVSIMAAAPALAQDTAATGGTVLNPETPVSPGPSATPNETVRTEEGEIIVTARNYVPEGSITANKTDIPLIETPQSVSVITRDQIDLLNFIDAQQAVRYTAGVFGENYGPDLRFDFLTVRGFTPKQYIDGLAAPVSSSILSVGVDLYAFESMDLLKGPSSVLYGNAPPGGIYNQTSRRSSREFGGEFGARYGTDDYKQLNMTVTGPVNEALTARFTGLYRNREAERDFVKAERLLAAPTATLRIGPDTSLTGLFYYQWDKVQGETNGFLPVFGTLLPNPIGKIDRDTNLGDPDNLYKRRQYGVGYDFAHDFTNAIGFRSNLKWSKYREDTPTGVYGSGGLINTTDPTSPTYFRSVLQSNFTYQEKVSSFAIDNRFDITLDTGALRHKLLLGLDYRNVLNRAAFSFIFNTGTIDLFEPVFNELANPVPGYATRFNEQRLKQTGIYAQDQIKIGDLYLLASGRYDWVKSRYIPPFGPVAVDTPKLTQKQRKFTWRVGANYVSPSGFAPYVSYATSFEPLLGTDFVTNEQFDPTTGKQIEAGIKYDARGLSDDVRVFLTAALFQIKQKNVVSTSPSVTPVFGTQSGAVKVEGGEIELVARIREQISINGSYSYNKSKVTENVTNPVEVGEPLPTTPKHKASLLVDYTIQSGSLGGLGFGLGARYTSRSAGSLPGPFNPVVYYGEAATLFDALIHYDTPEWRFAINGSNILDKTYVARCSGPAGCTYGAGRQVIGSITKKF